jgi:hypothetical protein
MPDQLTETIEYTNIEEVKGVIGGIFDRTISHGFGRFEVVVVNHEPTGISARLEFKLKRRKPSKP